MAVGAYASAYFTVTHGKALEGTFAFLGDSPRSMLLRIVVLIRDDRLRISRRLRLRRANAATEFCSSSSRDSC